MEATVAQNWEIAYTNQNRWYVHLLPSLTDFAFLLPFFLLFRMLPGAQVLLSDSDTGWHIRTGDWILQHRMVPTEDIFSFTKTHQAWFAWEWGWDVIFACIHRVSGLAGVVLVNAILLGLASALLFRLIRRCSNNDALAVLFTPLAVCACMMHWLARPHLVSWIFILVFLHAIASAENGKLRGLYWLPLATLFWTNLHGGFVVGIVLLATSAIAEVAKAFFRPRNVWRAAYSNSRPYLLATIGCAAVTFINPYTWHLHQHVWAYLRDANLLDNIQEFQSINFHNPSMIFFECVLLLGIPAGFWCLRAGRVAAALSILLWGHLALKSARNAPLFVLIAAPWIAAMSLDLARGLADVRWLRKLGAGISDICAEFRPLERIERCHLVSIAAVLFVACSLAAGRPGFAAQFSAKTFPIRNVPQLESLKGLRVFTSDQWSGYLIYRFYPAERVFMDGRSDFYGDKFVNTYQHIMAARYDCEAALQRFAIDAVIVPPDAPLATVLKQSSRWKTAFDNGSVIVFRSTEIRRGPLAHPRGENDFSLNLKKNERRSL